MNNKIIAADMLLKQKFTDEPQNFALFINPPLPANLQRWGDFSHTINVAFLLRKIYPKSSITIFLCGQNVSEHSQVFKAQTGIQIQNWTTDDANNDYDVTLTYSMMLPDDVKYKMHINLEDLDGIASEASQGQSVYQEPLYGKNVYGIKLGFNDKKTLGVILDPEARKLKEWFDSLDTQERQRERLAVLQEVFSNYNLGKDFSEYFSENLFGLCYMALDTDKYLQGLARAMTEADAVKGKPVVFTVISKEDVKERQYLQSQTESLGFKFIDLAEMGELAELADKEAKAIVINLSLLPRPLFQRLMLFSDLPVGITGASSIIEAIIFDKVFIYEVRPWLTGVAESFKASVGGFFAGNQSSMVRDVLEGKNIIISERNMQANITMSDTDEVKIDDKDQKIANLATIFQKHDEFKRLFKIYSKMILKTMDFSQKFKQTVDGLWGMINSRR